MKILHITPSYEPAWEMGGVVQSLSQLCRGLARLGSEVTVYTTDKTRNRRLEVPLNQPVQVGGVKVYYFRADYSLKFTYSQALRQACRDFRGKFDIVHLTAFWNYPGIVGGHYARKWAMPYVVSTAETVRPSAMREKSFKKWLYLQAVELRNLRGAAAIRCVTEMERRQNAYLPVTTPTFVLPNGIDLRDFAQLPRREAARQRWGIAENASVGLFVGRLARVKHVDLLIDGLAEAKRRGTGINFIIAGPDWGEMEQLKAKVATLGMEQQVSFLGAVSPETRNSLLAAADFLALTSEEESFGYAAVEALFAGRPVLISEGVGICHEVAAEGAGLVVPLQVGAIAQAIEKLGRDKELLAQMGEKGYRCARKHFEIMGVSKKMLLAYEDILSHKRSAELFWSDADTI